MHCYIPESIVQALPTVETRKLPWFVIVIAEHAENGSCQSVGWPAFEMCPRMEVYAPVSDGSITILTKQKAKCKFCMTALLLFDILDKDYFNINCTYFKGLLRAKFEERVEL
jgi:hypothetical protein